MVNKQLLYSLQSTHDYPQYIYICMYIYIAVSFIVTSISNYTLHAVTYFV